MWTKNVIVLVTVVRCGKFSLAPNDKGRGWGWGWGGGGGGGGNIPTLEYVIPCQYFF